MISVPRILDAKVLSFELASIGVVTKTLLDVDNRMLCALFVKPGPFRRTKILELGDIERIEDDKVVLTKGSSLIRKKDSEYLKLYSSGASLIGRHVSNLKGSGLGKVRSANYHLGNGRLESISISKNAFVTLTNGGYLVEDNEILSFSDNEIKISDDKLITTGSRLTDQMSALGTRMASLRREAENLISSRESSFIVGKTSSRDIIDEEGERVVKRGEIITDDHISRATKARKLHQLTLAAGSVEILSRYQKWKNKK